MVNMLTFYLSVYILQHYLYVNIFIGLLNNEKHMFSEEKVNCN